MDWIAQKLGKVPQGGHWKDFAGPSPYTNRRQRQAEAASIIRAVLEDPNQQQELEVYLQSAMQLSAEETHAILWEPPRALMTAVLPTLLRRLESDWKRFQLPGEPDLVYHTSNPLPDFVPSSLFSDLLLPEVRIVTPPPNRRETEPGEYFLPILQSLKTFAPGRVSRRFGVQRSQISWATNTGDRAILCRV